MAKKAGSKKETKKPRDKKPRKPKIKTAAENAKGPKGPGEPEMLSEKLGKPFSLVTCKRLIALVEQHNRDASRLEGLKETRKSVIEMLKQSGLENAKERDLAVQKYHVETEMAQKKASVKAGYTDCMRIIMEACGGTLFEVADDDSSGEGGEPDVPGQGGLYSEVDQTKDEANREVALGLTRKPVLALPPGRSDAKVKDDKGHDVPAFYPFDNLKDGGLCSTWWAWFRAGVTTWDDKGDPKIGAQIRRLEAVKCPTPALLLTEIKKWFGQAKSRKAAIEALPELVGWFAEGVQEILVKCGTGVNREDLAEMLVSIAKANVDAFIEWVGGPDAPLNKIRLEAEAK